MTRRKNQPHRTLLRTGLLVLFLIFFFLLYPSPARTLTCGPPFSPWVSFRNADAVFLGTVMKEGHNYTDIAVLKVIKVWKGVSETKVNLYPFVPFVVKMKLKGRYLIYASKRNGRFEAGMCGRSREARDVEVELHILDLIVKGIGRKAIYEELVKIALSPKSKANRLQALYIIGSIDARNVHSLPKNTFDLLKPLVKDSDPELRSAANQALILIKRKRTIYPNLNRWK